MLIFYLVIAALNLFSLTVHLCFGKWGWALFAAIGLVLSVYGAYLNWR